MARRLRCWGLECRGAARVAVAKTTLQVGRSWIPWFCCSSRIKWPFCLDPTPRLALTLKKSNTAR